MPSLSLDPHVDHASLADFDEPFSSEIAPQSPIRFAPFRTSGSNEPEFSETHDLRKDQALKTDQRELQPLRQSHPSFDKIPEEDNLFRMNEYSPNRSPVLADDESVNLAISRPSYGLCNQQDAPFDVVDDVEEMVREDTMNDGWHLGYPSPSPSASSTSSTGSYTADLNILNLQPEHSGILHQLFDQQTCGILSIKDGPGENPWRTLIWPMAHIEPALYYAILSMTACHAAKHDTSLKVTGSEMQGLSIKLLRERLFAMRTDAAVATTLVLAFSESWLSHIHTGITHLRGAREFISRGLQQQEMACMNPEELARVRFLRSTWVYMDIIARLTAVDGEDPEDLDSIAMPVYGPDVVEHEIDPLMGCATTLFPLIGSVANLVRQVRRTSSNSRRIVSRAAGLKYLITKWKAPAIFKRPQDESLEVDHSRNTAEAYRWAILLYLCQAVPMICTEEPAVMAERALDHLSAVPISSRSVIIHIFPLLAAGCEAVNEDRCFVEERWTAMMTRMCIGNIDRCWDVVKEVWRRRDAAAQGPLVFMDSQLFIPEDGQTEDLSVRDVADFSMESKKRWLSNSMNLLPFYTDHDTMRHSTDVNVKIDPEMTVRGSLHWVAVMTERKWESGWLLWFIVTRS